MRRSLIGIGGLLAAATALPLLATPAFAGNGTPLNTGSANALTLAVYGDAPYGTTPTDTAEFEATPAFIDSINNDPHVDVVAHVGDIHSGKQFCTEAYARSVADLWTQFKDPVVYTPRDNEWADCHKAGEGGNVKDANGNPVDYANGNPVANLALVRSIFFPQPGVTLGGRKKQVISQAQSYDPAHPTDANYVENVMWEQSKMLFVTVDLPGGSNNDADNWYGAARTQEQTDEIAQRTGADLRWIDAAFAQARTDGVGSMVIVTQADMWDFDGKPASHIANYDPFIQHIATGTQSLGRPVLLFTGDSHQYRSDNPLVQGTVRDRERSRNQSVPGRRVGGAPGAEHAQRAQLPPRRRPRQHLPAGVAEAHRRPPGIEPDHWHLVRPVQLGQAGPVPALTA